MDKFIDLPGEAAVLLTIDASSEYLQAPVRTKDRGKTVFTSQQRFYRSEQMLFGLQDAPSTFQQTQIVALQAYKSHFALVYLYNSVVRYRSAAKHMDHVKHVLTLFRDARVTVQVKNSSSLRKLLIRWDM